jgi:soluble lytic murein transglycosylase
MFNPRISIKFANTHLDYLNKHLYHPLFVAYAYNAGIGYTRRLIRKNIFKKGLYEPYISLEMVDNEQARYYGKRVLGNYVIYRKLLGSPIKITTLLNWLDKPELTDRFR